MFQVMLSLVLVVGFAGVSSAQDAQEPSAWVAAQTCSIKPTEGAALRAALREFIDYIVANPVDLPGNVYGAFRQRVNDTANFSLVVEVESIAEWSAWQSARFEANRNDEKRGALYQAYRAHIVPQSCNWSVHQRGP